MQITSIRLTNVRRFIQPVEITGLGSGINVLSAPNEHGKSTIFDALHAAFFTSHTSKKGEVRSLFPHVGGDPHVTIAFTADDSHWRLEKQWSTAVSRQSVKLWRDDVLFAQAGQAEDAIAALLEPPQIGGPAGLLWVRQGLTGLEKTGNEATARQSLLTSVAGEIDAMTGGRRMDAILEQISADLALSVTGTGRPKKGGPLETAEQDVSRLTEQHQQLSSDFEALEEAIGTRNRLRREKARLEDPADAQARSEALVHAQSALDIAETHKAALSAATDAARVAELELQAAKDREDYLRAALAEADTAQEALTNAQSARDTAQGTFTDADAIFAETRDAVDAAREAALAARQIYQKAISAEQGARANAQRVALSDRLRDAEAARATSESALAKAQSGPTPALIADLRKRETALAVAKAARLSAAPALIVSYSGSARVFHQGAVVPEDSPMRLPEGGRFDLEGIGHLTMRPGTSSAATPVEDAEAALRSALDASGHPDLPSAERAAHLRDEAEREAAAARITLQSIAPNGIDALRAELQRLPEPVSTDADLPQVADAALADERAHEAQLEAVADNDAARTQRDTTRDALLQCEGVLSTAKDRVERAQLALSVHEDPQAALDALTKKVAERAKKCADAQAALSELQARAPDIDTLTARRDRARTAIETARQQLQAVQLDLRGLEATISTRAGEAIQEELAATAEQLEAARMRHRAIADDCAVLQRLITSLDAARSSARERYVTPVLRELDPLVRMMWPEAELRLDPDTLLPTNLVRRGTEERVDVLSGGTREQIALLVRLAFARMLARDGRPAPVILDDAIVYSDDDRIVTMFDALTRQATDLQVIVFSCRQRAFRDLGGRALRIEPA